MAADNIITEQVVFEGVDLTSFNDHVLRTHDRAVQKLSGTPTKSNAIANSLTGYAVGALVGRKRMKLQSQKHQEEVGRLRGYIKADRANFDTQLNRVDDVRFSPSDLKIQPGKQGAPLVKKPDIKLDSIINTAQKSFDSSVSKMSKTELREMIRESIVPTNPHPEYVGKDTAKSLVRRGQ
jgi:hypothetical protein